MTEGYLIETPALLNLREHFGAAPLCAYPILIRFSKPAGCGRRWGDELGLVRTVQLPFWV